MRRTRLLAAALALGMLCCGLFTGCAPAAPALSGVTVVVYQPRSDVIHGRLAIQVRNGSDEPLEIVGASLNSPDFVAATTWPHDSTTVPAGRAVDLRAPVPEVRCASGARPVATIEFVADGVTAAAEIEAEDPYDLLPRLHRETCLAEEVAEVAVLTPLEVIQPEGVAPAVLVIGVEPTGAPSAVTIDAVGGTPLLKPTLDGRASDRVPVGVSIGATGPTEARIAFVPNRCDPHALLEDKVGTIIPLYVTTATQTEMRLMLPVTDRQRADFYEFFAAYCGLPG